MLLPVLYAGFILLIATLTLGHIEDNTSLLEGNLLILGILFYVLAIIAGLLFIAALVKPFFARPGTKRISYLLSRKKESAFYAFVEKLCRTTGTKIPKSIEVDCSTLVSATYTRGLISFLEDDLTLTIGLPTASEMTISEFTSLLIHELARFTQKTELRLSSLMSMMNQWFSRSVYEQDEIDEKLAAMSLTTSSMAVQIPLAGVKFFIWISRKILTLFMLAGKMISGYFERRIESNADLRSVTVAGFESFKSSLKKLHVLTASSGEAYSLLKSQNNPNDNSLPDNFISLIASIIQQDSSGEELPLKKNGAKEKSTATALTPSEQKRIDSVKTVASKELYQSDKPASTLFANFEELSKTASIRMYREILRLRFEKEDLITTDRFYRSAGLSSGPSDMDAKFF